MNENVCLKSASEAQSNFGGVSERLLTERECCGGVCPIVISAGKKDGMEEGGGGMIQKTQTCTDVEITFSKKTDGCLKLLVN